MARLALALGSLVLGSLSSYPSAVNTAGSTAFVPPQAFWPAASRPPSGISYFSGGGGGSSCRSCEAARRRTRHAFLIPLVQAATKSPDSSTTTTENAPSSPSASSSDTPLPPPPSPVEQPPSARLSMRTSSSRAGRQLFFDEINFCLQSEDDPMSGPSKTKTLNTFANKAVKRILIGIDFCFGEMAERVKEELKAQYPDDEDLDSADDFLDAVTALSPCSKLVVAETQAKLNPFYHQAYDRVMETLLVGGCQLMKGVVAHDPDQEKMFPRDFDISLSLYDTLTKAPTKTKVLNVMSNRVLRTMLYGGEEESQALLREMEAGFSGFLNDWVAGKEDSDEALYYSSLMNHLSKGLDAAAPEFKGAYANAYQRLVTILVKELGTRAVPVNREVFDSFVRWETSLRKNLTEVLWDPHPKELTGSWNLLEGLSEQGWEPALPLQPLLFWASGKRVIQFRKDGTVKVPTDAELEGTWRLEPGPTHLDTIHFDLVSSNETRMLSYTGYIDRGQRIETRFSGRPIVMTGRVLFKVRGEVRGNIKFSMELLKNMGLFGVAAGGGDRSAQASSSSSSSSSSSNTKELV